METLRQHPGITSIVVGVVAVLIAIYVSPGGDLVAVSILEAAAVALGFATYVVLRRRPTS
jgi:hypothetical protein